MSEFSEYLRNQAMGIGRGSSADLVEEGAADEIDRLEAELVRVGILLRNEMERLDIATGELWSERWEKAKESPNTKLAVWLQEHPWRNLQRHYLLRWRTALKFDR